MLIFLFRVPSKSVVRCTYPIPQIQ
ncbi:MAG: CRISPR-associated protein Cas5 [Planctomycetota bacterium]